MAVTHQHLLLCSPQGLENVGCLKNTAVFFADPGAPLGTKLATIMAAAAAGERVRDEGGHALVVLDDLSPLSSESAALLLDSSLYSCAGQSLLARPVHSILICVGAAQRLDRPPELVQVPCYCTSTRVEMSE